MDPDLGTVRVTRAIEVTACGRIINPKASHSQEIGGVVWGIGMALQEATEIDHRYGDRSVAYRRTAATRVIRPSRDTLRTRGIHSRRLSEAVCRNSST